MPRKYKYYCRRCKKVTDWIIFKPRLGIETHACNICKTTVDFIVKEDFIYD